LLSNSNRSIYLVVWSMLSSEDQQVNVFACCCFDVLVLILF
jgi:hypothetical protein